MLMLTVVGWFYCMGKVANPGSRKHQLVPQNPPDMNKLLEISLALTESGQGLSQPQSCMFPCA